MLPTRGVIIIILKILSDSELWLWAECTLTLKILHINLPGSSLVETNTCRLSNPDYAARPYLFVDSRRQDHLFEDDWEFAITDLHEVFGLSRDAFCPAEWTQGWAVNLRGFCFGLPFLGTRAINFHFQCTIALFRRTGHRSHNRPVHGKPLIFWEINRTSAQWRLAVRKVGEELKARFYVTLERCNLDRSRLCKSLSQVKQQLCPKFFKMAGFQSRNRYKFGSQ